MPYKCRMLFAASARNQRWWCHAAGLVVTLACLSLENLLLGLLDLQAPCSLPFCVLQVQFQITEAKLRPVLYPLSLQCSLGSTVLIQPLLFLIYFSYLWVNRQKPILFCCFLPNRQLLSPFTFRDWMKIKYYTCWECMFTRNDNFKIVLFHFWN